MTLRQIKRELDILTLGPPRVLRRLEYKGKVFDVQRLSNLDTKWWLHSATPSCVIELDGIPAVINEIRRIAK